MTKKQYMIYIEEKVNSDYEFMVGPGNKSSSLQSMMENFIAAKKADSSIVNIQLLRSKSNDLTKQASKINAELSSIRQQIEMYEKQSKDIEIKKLEEEKAKIEAQTKCIHCQSFIDGKRFATSLGDICSSCFHNAREIGKTKLWWPG